MASLRISRRRLFVDFYWKGLRCREWLGLADSPANRVTARRRVREIDGAIASGRFDYLASFPDGAKSKLFARAPVGGAPPQFTEHVRRWIDNRKPWLAGGTEYDYRRIIEAHLVPHFGERPVSEITVEDVETLVAAVKERKGTRGRKLSNRRTNMILNVLRLTLDPVLKRGWLEDNPARQVQHLKEERSNIDPLSFDEVKQLLANGFNRPADSRYFLVAIFTGLRPSEQIGLQWEAIDWAARPPRIGVRQGVTRRGGTSRPKTAGSYRDVIMVPIVHQALREQQAANERTDPWVFPNNRGGHLNITNIRERVWKPALKRAGVRTRAFYQTRHTFATLALSSGETIGWVAEMLGHTNTEMVIRHYHKFIPNLTRQDGSALARQIEQAGLG